MVTPAIYEPMPDPVTRPAAWAEWVRPLCSWVQTRFGHLPGHTREEAQARVNLLAVRCVRLYRPDLGEFSSYFASAYQNEKKRITGRYYRSPRSPASRGKFEVSLSVVASDGERTESCWQPSDTREVDPARDAAAKVDCAAVLCRLSPRDADMLFLYYGCELTLEDIGRRYGITRERVRQVTDRALADARRRAGVLCAA